jgi:hypothetical protein
MGRSLEIVQRYATLSSMIEPDKIQHLIAGLVIYMLACIVMPPLSCFIICSFFAFGKEFLDSSQGRRFNMEDFLFTMLGGTLGLILDLLFF